MIPFTYEIQTTDGPYNPDEWASVGVGPDGMIGASSTVWLRVGRGDWSTGWHRCVGVVSMHRARDHLEAALDTHGDVGEEVAVAFEVVTGSAWPG